MPTFSERHGFGRSKEIKYREDVPEHVRWPIYRILTDAVSTKVLLERAHKLFNPYGLGSVPSYGGPVTVARTEDNETIEFERIFRGCTWFQTFDIIEDAIQVLQFHEREFAMEDDEPRAFPLQEALNHYFVYAGIGWQIVDGEILARGDDAFEQTVNVAEKDLKYGGRNTAAERIHRAIQGLSARPNPDFSGAISHATGALECILGDITGEKMTLGDYLKQHPDLFSNSIKKSLEGLWGYASSEGARHGQEGVEPPREEAEFIVSISAAVTTYLNRKHPRPSS